MAYLKSALKSALLPVRKAGGRFFAPSLRTRDSVIWKAAQISITELIGGDYLEFGVFRGTSFIEAYRVFRDTCRSWSTDEIHSSQFNERVREIWHSMRFFAFDSFRGLPELRGLDCHTNDFAEGQYACTLPSFLSNLKRNRVDLEKVITVPGWFSSTCTEETVQKYNMQTAAVVYVDCDLLESATAVLKFIEPLMADGTVLVFDDWYGFRGNPEIGVQRAFTEWAKDKPDWTFTQYQKQSAWQNSFIANRKGVCGGGGSLPSHTRSTGI